MNHKSNALQDVYLIQTHFRLEKFEYYESLMKRIYAELELKHCMLEELQSRIEALEKENTSLKKDATRYQWLRDGGDELAEIIANNIPQNGVAQFLKLVESKYEDWGVAEDIAKFYVKAIVDLLVDYPDDAGWNDEFKEFLLEQANRL